jgi:hypothetical protein
MSECIRNGDLFRRIADALEKHPELHEQNYYGLEHGTGDPCDTAHCIAGWAVSLSGYKPALLLSGSRNWNMVSSPDDQVARHTPIVAQELLGLTDKESDFLFHYGWKPNDIEPVRSVPEALRRIADCPDNDVCYA